MNKRFHPIALAVGLSLLGGCQPATTAPAPTSKPTHTPLPPPSATVAASATSTPAAAATATLVVPLSQTGPWLAIHDNYSIWAANSDGTGLTEISNNYDYSDMLIVSIAPRGGRLAFFFPPFLPDQMVGNPPKLMLIKLPSTSLQLLTPLHSGVPLNGSQTDFYLDGNVFAVFRQQIFAWSPDGSLLAFLGAQDGPSTDLYIYSTRTDLIKRLTSGPTQALDPSWSPDGQYIVSNGIKDMNFAVGGSNGPAIDTVWAVRPDGSDLRAIFSFPADDFNPPYLIRAGWVSNRAYVEYSSALGCGNFQLSLVNILTPSRTTLLPGAFNSVALDPQTGSVLVLIPNIPDDQAYLRDCGDTPGPGLYLISLSGSRSTQKLIFEVPTALDGVDHVLGWSSAAQLFFIFNDQGISTVDLQGQVYRIDISVSASIYQVDMDNLLFVSPDGQSWAFSNSDGGGLWIASRDHPALRIFKGWIDDILWTPDGTALLFSSEDVVYRATGPDYAVESLAGPLSSRESYFGVELDWVMP